MNRLLIFSNHFKDPYHSFSFYSDFKLKIFYLYYVSIFYNKQFIHILICSKILRILIKNIFIYIGFHINYSEIIKIIKN